MAFSGSPCWVSAVIESGLLLPTEQSVSELSQIVYRVIKSLHTNTCQLCSASTKTFYLTPSAVHLQLTSNGQRMILCRYQLSQREGISILLMILKDMIGVI